MFRLTNVNIMKNILLLINNIFNKYKKFDKLFFISIKKKHKKSYKHL